MEICDLVCTAFNKCFEKNCISCPFEGVPGCKKLVSFLLFIGIKRPDVLEDFYNENEME